MTANDPIGSFGPFPDWRPGFAVDRCCLKKVVFSAGLASFSGDAQERFAPAFRYLARRCGFDAHDYLEATYAGSVVDGRWQPRGYHVADIQRGIAVAAADLVRELEWYRERLPATRFYLVGYSLGGVLAFEAADQMLTKDQNGWRGRLAGVACLSSPLLGAGFGILDGVARDVSNRPDAFGRSGAELVARAGDPETVAHLEATAALLRECGVRLLFVGDRHDAVVTTRDAVLPSARAAKESVIVEARLPAGSDRLARTFGHGPVVADPATLEAIARLVGRQECLRPGTHAADDPSTDDPAAGGTDLTVELELERLKREMGKG